MDQSSPEKSTNMRFGYDFKLPEASSEKDEISFKGCTWYYGVAEDDLKNTFSPDKTNFIDVYKRQAFIFARFWTNRIVV